MHKKKVVIISPLLGFVPQVYYYTKLLDEQGIGYDIIQWNRRGEEIVGDSSLIYNIPTDDYYPAWKKVIEICKFTSFAKKIIRKREYHSVIVFNIAIALFFPVFLKRRFNRRYIFDIRDYSPIMNNVFGRLVIKYIMRNSALNVISSQGFLEWLPFKDNIKICHNVGILNCDCEEVAYNRIVFNNPIRVLTIGAIRDYQANTSLLESLLNDERFEMQFSGSSPIATELEQYAKDKNIRNVIFTGRYKKEDEEELVRNTDLINSILGQDINSKTLMTNRMYLSVLLQKPIIVNSNCYQAEVVGKYALGVVIRDDNSTKEQILEYCNTFNYDVYLKGCKDFISKVNNDNEIWRKAIIDLMN